jgi:hypothetical protein
VFLGGFVFLETSLLSQFNVETIFSSAFDVLKVKAVFIHNFSVNKSG